VIGDRCSNVSQRYVDRDARMRFDADRVGRDLALRQRLRPWKV